MGVTSKHPLTRRYHERMLRRHPRTGINAQHVWQRQRHVRHACVCAVIAHPQLGNLHIQSVTCQ